MRLRPSWNQATARQRSIPPLRPLLLEPWSIGSTIIGVFVLHKLCVPLSRVVSTGAAMLGFGDAERFGDRYRESLLFILLDNFRSLDARLRKERTVLAYYYYYPPAHRRI
jgi:hypothetical protein